MFQKKTYGFDSLSGHNWQPQPRDPENPESKWGANAETFESSGDVAKALNA
jgi:hypothetical protein